MTNDNSLVQVAAQPATISARGEYGDSVRTDGTASRMLGPISHLRTPIDNLTAAFGLLSEQVTQYEADCQALLASTDSRTDEGAIQVRTALLAEADVISRFVKAAQRQSQAWQKHIDRLSGRQSEVRVPRSGKRGEAYKRVEAAVQDDMIVLRTSSADGSGVHKLTLPLPTFRHVVESAAHCGARKKGSDYTTVVRRVRQMVAATSRYKRSARSVVWAVVNLMLKERLFERGDNTRRFRLASGVTVEAVCFRATAVIQKARVPAA